MIQTGRLSRSALLAAVVATLLIIAGIVCLVLGWPERHAWQSALLQLSGFCYAAAASAAVVQMSLERGLHRNQDRKPRYVRIAVLALVGLGVLVALLGFVTNAANVVPFGQFLVWIGLAIAFFYLAFSTVGRRSTRRAFEVDHEFDDLLVDDDAPDVEPVPAVVTNDVPLREKR